MRDRLIILLLAAAAVSFYVGYSATPYPTTPTPAPQPLSFSNSVTLPLLAVDSEGSGVLADLVVDVSKGSGKFYIGGNVSPLVNSDTQSSLKTAFTLAQKLSGRLDFNAYYSFSTDSEAVGGRSAGAAATMATLSAIHGKTLNPKMLITGTIEEDGSIGPVGRILEKAKAVKKDGRFTALLVPPRESKQSVFVEECVEKNTENSYYRQCTSKPRVVDVANETGLTIIEVSNARQAYDMMTKTE